MDYSGLDPYALIKCEGKTVRTPTFSDTANPEWNAGALFFVRRPKETHLVVQVMKHSIFVGLHVDNFKAMNI